MQRARGTIAFRLSMELPVRRDASVAGPVGCAFSDFISFIRETHFVHSETRAIGTTLQSYEDRHSAILDSLADHVLEHGLSASSLRALAAAAGTSDRMLLYYFKDKTELIAATLTRIAERLMGILDGERAKVQKPVAELQAELAEVLFSDRFWPFMRLWLEIASLSAKGDPLCRATGGQIGRAFLAWGATQIEAPDAQVRERDAARLLLTIEGMLLLKSIGLDDVVDRAF